MNKIKVFLVLLLFGLGGLDIYFAIQNPELEANPGLIVLRETMGLGWAWGMIIFMKFLVLAGAAFLLMARQAGSERRLFFALSLVSLLILTQSYGIYTGVRAGISVTEAEEQQGYPLTQVQRQQIAQDTSSVSLVQYNQSVFFLSILPILTANFTFWIFTKLRKDVKIAS